MQSGGVRCFSWPIMACQGDGEVEIFLGGGGDIFGGGGDICGGGGDEDGGRLEKLRVEGKEGNKEKGKRKRNEKIFSWKRK